MSEQSNENELTTGQIQGVLKEVNRRLQKNLELLDSLRKARETLETILEEAKAQKAEREKAAEFAAADAGGPEENPKTGGEGGKNTGEEQNDDPLYSEAVKLFRKEKRISATLLQRRFLIGYGRAKKLLTRMAAEGVFDTIPIPEDWRTPRGIILKPVDPEE